MPPEIAPDCRIAVVRGARRDEYELYSGAVLHEPRTNRSWQFYFGLLLLEWLYA